MTNSINTVVNEIKLVVTEIKKYEQKFEDAVRSLNNNAAGTLSVLNSFDKLRDEIKEITNKLDVITKNLYSLSFNIKDYDLNKLLEKIDNLGKSKIELIHSKFDEIIKIINKETKNLSSSNSQNGSLEEALKKLQSSLTVLNEEISKLSDLILKHKSNKLSIIDRIFKKNEKK